MKREPHETPPTFVLEALEDGARHSEAFARELDRAAASLASALTPQIPSTAARERLLAAATNGPMRHAPFFDRLARLFDLGRDAVVDVLQRATAESEWEPGPHPDVRVMHLRGGPAVEGADTGLVRMPAGFVWPRHRHGGVERVLLLEGQYTDSGGSVYKAGDLHEMGPGSEHSFVVPPGPKLLLAVVLYGGLELL